MRKIKFKTEYVPLSDEVINSHKNFDQLLSAYVAAPKPNWFKQFIQKKWTMFGGGLMTGAIITSLLWYNQETLFENDTLVQESQPAAEQQLIKEQQPKAIIDSLQFAIADEIEQEHPANIDAAEEKNTASTASLTPDTKGKDVLANGNAVGLQNGTVKGSTEKVQQHIIDEPLTPVVTRAQQPIESAESTMTDVIPAGTSIPLNDQSAIVADNLVQTDTTTVELEKQVAVEHNALSSGNIDTGRVLEPVVAAVVPEAKTELSATDSAIIVSESKDKDGNLLPGVVAGAAIIAAPSLGDKSNADKNTKSNNSDKQKSKGKEKQESNAPEDITAFNADSTVNDASVEKKKGWFVFGTDSSKVDKTAGGSKMDSMRAAGKTPEQLSQDSLYTPRYAQVSFITPLSSNGIDGYKYMHYFSLNILQGYNGALEGAEFGGLLNGVKGYVTGAQFGGLANFAGGNLKGAQFGGLANFTGGYVKGAQFGGLVNVGESVDGAQFAGIANVSGSYVTGFQAAGITNISADSLNGAQVAGIVNIVSSEKQSTGWQVAGVGNVSLAEAKGGQIGGVFNVANRLVGAQISLINFGQNVDGVQIGLINISDTLKGAAIGLVSVSSDGVFDVALWTSDFLMFNGGIRVGTKSVYNIYAYGVSPFLSDLPFGFGIGIGGHIPVKKKAFIEIDGMAWSMHRSYVSFDEINMINQLRVMGGYRFNKYFSVFAGPTLNVSVQSNRYEPFLDNYFYESVSENNTVRLAPGFVAGVRLF